MEPAENKDFFISYAPIDRPWAEWIAWQLEAAGYTTIIQDWDFHAGSNSMLDTHQATIQAARTIAVLSPDYLATPSTSAEWTTALHRDPTGEQGTLLPIQVQASKVEGLLGPITSIDLVGLDESTAIHTLLQYIPRERRKPVTPPSFPSPPSFPGPSTSTSPIWEIPYSYNNFFVGREDILSLLDSQFQIGEPKTQTLSGLGGIGKTQIALKYAYDNRNKKKYSAILWLSAETRETLQKDARTIAQSLNLLPEEFTPSLSPEIDVQFPPDREQAGIVRGRREKTQEKIDPLRVLKKWLENNPQWLLILDNIEDSALLQDILPGPGRNKGHILLTTRQTVLKNLALIPVEKVTPDDGAAILLNRALPGMSKQAKQLNNENREFAKKLSEEMDGLPLALDQARAYIQETQSSIKEYLELYNDQAKRTKLQLLEKRGELLEEEHPQSVVTTFQISFDKIKSIDLIASQVLQVCAFLYPDTIPEKIIAEAIKVLSKAEKAIERDEIAEAIQPLLRYSLLHRNWGNETYTIHRVLQAVLQDNILADQQQLWVEKTISILNSTPIPLDQNKLKDDKKSPQRSLAQFYSMHAQVCAKHIKTWNIQSAEAVELLNRTGAYLYQQREYAQAEEFYEGLLRIKKLVEGASNLDRARTLGILANLTYLQKDKGKYEKAAKNYEDALSIYKREPSPNDPYIGQMLQQYAMLLRRLKRWKDAEAAARQERQIWKSMSFQEKKRLPWGWIGSLDWSFYGEIELGRYNLVSALLGQWGIAYCMFIGIPIACALLFHSWQWGWGSFILILIGLLATLSDKVRKNADQQGSRVGAISYLVLSIAVGVGGWQMGKILLTLWHLTSWPGPLQLILQGVSALLFCAVAICGLFAILSIVESQVVIPEYTVLPTLTFTFSLCGLPVISGLLLHSWWIFVGVLLGTWIWASSNYFLISWGPTIPYQRTLASFVFGCTWGYLGWIFAGFLNPHLPGNSWQQILPFLLTFAGFSLGFYCHIVAYRLLSAIGTEGNILLILEDLWVDFAVAKLLKETAPGPITDWRNFYFWQGMGYRRQKRDPDAIVSYTTLITVYAPTQSFYYVVRGDTYYSQQDLVHALADYKQAISLDPDQASAYQGCGNVYTNQGDYPGALVNFDKAIELHPKDSHNYFIRASAYHKQGDFTHAIADFDQAIALDPNNEFAYHGRGYSSLEQGNYPSAISAFDKAISYDPKFTSAYRGRGNAYARQGNYTSALADFSRVVWLDPHNALAYQHRGNFYLAQHDYPHAIMDFTQAIALTPDDALLYDARGRAYYEQSDYPGALADLNRVISLTPRYVDAYFGRSNIYYHQGDYLRAISDLSEVILLDPKNDSAYHQRGSIYYAQHEYSYAIADFSQAISLNPKDAFFYNSRGNAYSDQGNFIQAIADFDQAISLDPGLAAAYDGRGNAYSKQSDFVRASADFEQAHLLDPKNAPPTSSVTRQDVPQEIPLASDNAQTSAEATLDQSAFTVDGDAVLERVKHKDIPPSWRIHMHKHAYSALTAGGIVSIFFTGLCFGLVLGIGSLFHLPWHTWLLGLLLLIPIIWGFETVGVKKTKLVIMPEGFVYRLFSGEPKLSVHYEKLKEMTIQGEKVTLVFKNGEQHTTTLSVSTTALFNLQNAYQGFKAQKSDVFFMDGNAVLARVKQGNMPPSWQVYSDPNIFLTTASAGYYIALLTALCVGAMIGVATLFHLPWQSWLQWIALAALIFWGLITTAYGLQSRRTRLVVMPEGFVYRDDLEKEPDLSFHYDAIKEMSIQKKKVKLVFKNRRQETADFSVSEAALQHLQNTYLAFKAQNFQRDSYKN